MNSFTNDDLYQIVLDRLRKDRKGGIRPEEFESFLRLRNLDYFNGQFPAEGATKVNQDSLRQFSIFHEPLAVTQQAATGVYYVWLKTLPSGTTTTTPDAYTYPDNVYAHWINAWASTSATVWSTLVKIDIVSHVEFLDRLNNAITAPSATSPIGYIDNEKLWLAGLTTGFVILDYYKYPTDPYFDYYTDSSGNITYLTEGQASYTLQAGEVARDGSVAGAGVTSASADLEWGDQDAMNILDMVMTDLGVATTDQGVVQTSVMERDQNVKS